jgi:hypothetical protein
MANPNSMSNWKMFTVVLNLPVGNNTVTVVARDFALPTPFVMTSNYQVTAVDMPANTFAHDANGCTANMTPNTASATHQKV